MTGKRYRVATDGLKELDGSVFNVPGVNSFWFEHDKESGTTTMTIQGNGRKAAVDFISNGVVIVRDVDF